MIYKVYAYKALICKYSCVCMCMCMCVCVALTAYKRVKPCKEPCAAPRVVTDGF